MGRRLVPIPETLRCRACAEVFAWDGRSSRRPHYCDDAACRRIRSNERSYRYWLQTRSKGCGTQDRPGSVPRPLAPALPIAEARVTVPHESPGHVERLLEAARQARQREERATGQRRFTITDGWQQRGPGHYANPGADTQGEGWS